MTIGYGFTYRQSETCSLYEVVEFYKSVENLVLGFLWYSVARIFAIYIKSLILVSVSNLNMSLMGIFYSICYEVCDNLLYSSVIDNCFECLIRILLYKLYSRILHPLLQ